MFAKLLTVIVLATSVVAHPAILRRGDVSLSDWSSQNLESYWKFKMRYHSLNCASQNGTDFYTTCCYPLGASESLSSRPAECTPTTCSAPSSSTASQDSTPTYNIASVPTPSATGDEDLPFCEEGDDGEWDDEDTSSYSAYVAPTNYVASADYVAPTTTYSDPAPSSDNSQPTTTQAQDTPAPSGSSSGSNNNSGNVNYGGVATYYYQNGNPGACGDYHGDNDLIAAIDIDRYGDTSVKSSLCGQRVHIKNTNNGQTVEVVIADACPSCNNGNSIDLSYGAFGALANHNDGQVAIEWYFI